MPCLQGAAHPAPERGNDHINEPTSESGKHYAENKNRVIGQKVMGEEEKVLQRGLREAALWWEFGLGLSIQAVGRRGAEEVLWLDRLSSAGQKGNGELGDRARIWTGELAGLWSSQWVWILF